MTEITIGHIIYVLIITQHFKFKISDTKFVELPKVSVSTTARLEDVRKTFRKKIVHKTEIQKNLPKC